VIARDGKPTDSALFIAARQLADDAHRRPLPEDLRRRRQRPIVVPPLAAPPPDAEPDPGPEHEDEWDQYA